MTDYEQPAKGDLDRNLSVIMHAAHRKAMAERGRIISEAAAHGMAQSTRVIVAAAAAFDKIHAEAIDQAMPVVCAFADRMQVTPKQITQWARPHLENLGNTVLGQLPPAGFPAEHQRIREQYALVFQQRLDDVLRDLEIGFIKGASVAWPASANHSNDVLSLKPGFWGMNIDLKELWRRARKLLNP
jgi:hypothetical protein